MDPTTTDLNQKKVIRVYGAFGAGLILMLVPSFIAMLISGILLLGVLVVAYVLRTDTEEHSLIENHMTFIIRTMWIGCFFSLITMTLASIYLTQGVNHEPMRPCFEKFFAVMTQTQIPDFTIMEAIFRGCWDSYWTTNKIVFINSGIIGIVPIVLYFVIRYARGVSRAMSGYRIANPLAWF